MRSATAMQREVTDDTMVREGPESGAAWNGDDDEYLIAAKPLRIAAGAYEVQKQAAIDAGVKDESYFTKLCTGTKPAQLVHLWRLVQRNRKAARAVTEVFAGPARLVVVPMMDLKLEPQTAALLLRERHAMRRQSDRHWEAHRDSVVAPSLGTAGDLVDVALDYHEKLPK